MLTRYHWETNVNHILKHHNNPAFASRGLHKKNMMEVDESLQPPALTGNTEWHVFISHNSEDAELVGSIEDKLSGLGYKCNSFESQFQVGTPTIHNIIEAVEKSRRVLLILTPRFMQSKWALMEVALTLQRSGLHRKCLLIGLVAEMEMADVPPYIRYNARCFMDSDPGIIQHLQKAIQDDVTLDITPSGNVAHGLAWGYFYGYHNMILEGLPDRLSNRSNWMDKTPDKSLATMSIPPERVFKKFIIVMPSNCFCHSTFTAVDENIQPVALVPFKASRAGNPERFYPSSVYKVIHPRTGEEYFFAGEFSTPLMSIYEMAESNLSLLRGEEKELQRLLYCHKVQEIVSHKTNPHCNGRTLIMDYNMPSDGEETRLSEKIADAIEQQMKLAQTAVENRKIKYDGFILHTDTAEDQEEAEMIRDLLVEKGHTCLMSGESCQFGMGMFDDLIYGLNNSKRVILLVSPELLKSKELQLWSSIILEEYSSGKDECVTIPVVTNNVHMDTVPDHIKKVATCLRRDDTAFETKLLAGIEKQVPTTSLIPAGNISTGMAWTYFYGYLNLVVPGLEERLKNNQSWKAMTGKEQRLQDYLGDTSCHKNFLYNRLVLVIPDSCYCFNSLDANDAGFADVAIVEYKATRAGVMERPYNSTVLEVKDTTKPALPPLYCACEYVTPILTMHDMTGVAGLSEEDRDVQRRQFHENLIQILEHTAHEKLHGKVVIVAYHDRDEQKLPLSTVVYQKVQHELEKLSLLEEALKKMQGLQVA